MGLDMYLYSASKNYKSLMELAREKAKEFNDFSNSLFESAKYDSFNDLPKNEYGHIIVEQLTDNQKKKMEEFVREQNEKAKSLGGVNKNGSFMLVPPEGEDVYKHEIGYWRKEYELHEFIVATAGNPDDDNLVEIYLDESAIQKILEKYPYDEFRQALSIARGGDIVFYYAWY